VTAAATRAPSADAWQGFLQFLATVVGPHDGMMSRLWASVYGVLMLTALESAATDSNPGSASHPRSPSRSRAESSAERPPTEVEAVVAAGEASGAAHFGCSSQQTRVRYVVGAVEVRRSARPAMHPNGAGFTARAGAALEVTHEQVVGEHLSGEATSLPGDGVTATWAAHARLGHYDRWIGAEGGIGIVHKWAEASTRDSWVLPYPDVRVSVGPRDVFYGFVGLGNSQPSSMAVGPYAGLSWSASPRLRLETRLAIEAAHGSSQFRGDLVCFAQVAPRWWLRGGFGVGRETNQYVLGPPSGEANLGFVFAP